MSGLTGAHIRAALKAAGAGSGLCLEADAIAELFNTAMTEHGDGQFTTVERVAALVSECMMESDYFRTTQEYGSQKHRTYAPYVGRTFIQLTWDKNYRAFGAWCHKKGLVEKASYFADKPERLADHQWAALGGVYYFTQVHFAKGPLTAYADDILAVGRAVNLGSPTSKHTPLGQKHRARAYEVVRQLGDSIVPSSTPRTGRPFAMSGSKDVFFQYQGRQPLKAGENTVVLNDKEDKSVVVGANAGVDLVATVEVTDAEGKRYPGPCYSFFRVISYLKDTPATTVSSRMATASDQVSFKGVIGAVEKGRSARLRLLVEVPDDAPAGLVLDTVQITGWTL